MLDCSQFNTPINNRLKLFTDLNFSVIKNGNHQNRTRLTLIKID